MKFMLVSADGEDKREIEIPDNMVKSTRKSRSRDLTAKSRSLNHIKSARLTVKSPINKSTAKSRKPIKAIQDARSII